MADYDKILMDGYNPILIHGDHVTFPQWLTDQIVLKSQLPKIKNKTEEDQIINMHASFYDATVWYPWITNWTPKSILIKLSDEEINNLIYEQTLTNERKLQICQYLRDGYNFVKSSKKSSHQSTKVTTIDQFIEEMTHPNVVMSLKNGCRHVFLRQFINKIHSEYRIYVYQNQIRYIEEYLKKYGSLSSLTAVPRKKQILDYVEKVMKNIKYHDYILDICLLHDDSYLIIEINTPMYLFGGLHLGVYYYESDFIHTTPEPIFRYRNIDGEIEEI